MCLFRTCFDSFFIVSQAELGPEESYQEMTNSASMAVEPSNSAEKRILDLVAGMRCISYHLLLNRTQGETHTLARDRLNTVIGRTSSIVSYILSVIESH